MDDLTTEQVHPFTESDLEPGTQLLMEVDDDGCGYPVTMLSLIEGNCITKIDFFNLGMCMYSICICVPRLAIQSFHYRCK